MRRLKASHTSPLELPKGPSHPCCNSRSSPTYPSHSSGSRSVPPTSRGAPFPPPSERRYPFPAWSGKNSRRSRRISRGGALHRKGDRNSRVVPHTQSPPDVSVHSRETCFPCNASTFKPRIDSHHGARGTALCERLVGKTRGKSSWESLDGKPLIP